MEFAGFEVAGAGYINAKLDRAKFVHFVAIELARGIHVDFWALGRPSTMRGFEHTSINPNKAAHIGHLLRNAILGEYVCAPVARRRSKRSMCRTISTTPACRWRMWWWEFLHLAEMSVADVRALVADCEKALLLAQSGPHRRYRITTAAGISMRGLRNGMAMELMKKKKRGSACAMRLCMRLKMGAMRRRKWPS